MSILTSLLGMDDNALDERDIAMDMLKDSKFGVTALSNAAAEAVNPDLRNMLRTQLDTAVKDHFELSDLMIRKGWYPAYASPQDQLQVEKENSYDFTES